jgi:hypothetical protein
LGFEESISIGYGKSLEVRWVYAPVFVGVSVCLAGFSVGRLRVIGCGAGGWAFEAA